MKFRKKIEIPAEKEVEVKIVQAETKTGSTDIHWIKPTPTVVRDNPKDN